MPEERRLAAIMFSDVCGFSRIMGEDETRALAIIEMAGSCIDQAAAGYGGRVIKKMGDGVLCEFTSAVNAVRAAMAVQKAVSDHNETAPAAEKFQMRIGIHVGDVVVSEGDILGDGVNVASRIEPLAEPGGICISRDVFDLVKSKVLIETVNLGPHDLKNISRQVDIYKVLLDAVNGAPRVSTVVSAPPKKTGRKSTAWIAGITVAVMLVLLAGGRILQKGMAKKRAEKAFQSMSAGVRIDLEAGRAADAMEKITAYNQRFPGSVRKTEVGEMIRRVEDRLTRDTITTRQKEFFKAVESDDREKALAFIDPEVLRTVDGSAIWGRLKMATWFLKQADMSTDSFRIMDIRLDDNGEKAHVYMEALRRKPGDKDPSWHPTPPFQWWKVENAWYLHTDPKPLPSEEKSASTPDARPDIPIRRRPGIILPKR